MKTTLQIDVTRDLLEQVDTFVDGGNEQAHAAKAYNYIASITEMPLKDQFARLEKFTLPFLRERDPSIEEDMTLAYVAAATLTAKVERVRRTQTEMLLRAMEILDEHYDAGL